MIDARYMFAAPFFVIALVTGLLSVYITIRLVKVLWYIYGVLANADPARLSDVISGQNTDFSQAGKKAVLLMFILMISNSAFVMCLWLLCKVVI